MHYTLFILIAKVYLLHAFHVSVCDVVYNSDDKHLKISVRLFLDDLEKELKERQGSIRTSQYRYVTKNYKPELYDMLADPSQQNDISDDNVEIVNSFKKN